MELHLFYYEHCVKPLLRGEGNLYYNYIPYPRYHERFTGGDEPPEYERYPYPATMSVLQETSDGVWEFVIQVSGISGSLEARIGRTAFTRYPQYHTLHANINDIYIIGEHRINPLQEAIRHVNGYNPESQWSDVTNISRWNRTTLSGTVVGEVFDEGGDYPFDPGVRPVFSGMMRHFQADDGFWFGSTCVKFEGALGQPYVAFSDYPAEGENSWYRTLPFYGSIDMLYVEKEDYGRLLVSTTSGNVFILDTEDTFSSPYQESDLSSFIQTSGVVITGLDTLRIY